MTTTEQKSWRCLVCGYIHEGAEPPTECPVCGAPASEFEAIARAQRVEQSEPTTGKIVIAGAGIAGLSAAEAAREQAPEAEIVLISTEQELPYYRLNLTRFLAGELTEDELPIHPAEWYAQHNITLRMDSSVQQISPAAKTVQLQEGSVEAFDKLIMTTGAYPFIPPIEGTEKTGVLSLRTAADARMILKQATPGKQVVCVGGGILGLETAGALARRGAKVTVLEAYEHLMPRQLNPAAGEILLQHLKTLGIDVIKEARSAAIEGEGAVEGIRLVDGRVIPADVAMLTVGVRSNAWMLQEAGLSVQKGALVDNFMRTSHPDILAAGDVAEHNGIQYGSWAAAQFQGQIAGLNAAGKPTEFGGIPRAHSLKILGKDMVSLGRIKPEDGSDTLFEAYTEQGDYRLFMLRNHQLVGVLLVGDTSAMISARQALEANKTFSATSVDDIINQLA